MVCLGFEPRVTRWKAQTNPLSYLSWPHYTEHSICKLYNRSIADLQFDWFVIQPVWPENDRQMSVKFAQKWFH